MQDRLHAVSPDSALYSQICAASVGEGRKLRVPSDHRRSLTNTCSPRRPQAARRSARSASWCARLSTRPRRSRRWARQGRPRRRRCPVSTPPPRASTRTAGRSVVNRAGRGALERRRDARRSASRRSIARRGATDHPPAAQPALGGRARRRGRRPGAYELQRTRAAYGRPERLPTTTTSRPGGRLAAHNDNEAPGRGGSRGPQRRRAAPEGGS
jgi:hypothetical protein